MKKNFFSALSILVFFFLFMAVLDANSHDDYRVIKKSEKFQGESETVTLFKILVTDTATRKVKFKLTLPICLIDMISESQDDINIRKDHCDIDLKKFLKILKKKGNQFMIEAYEDGETVKIWFE